jgi:RHS repeat-associated protein
LQAYNAENRLSGVLQVTGDCDTLGDTLKAWQFTYDGDGAKVKQAYTDSYGTLTTYYYAGGTYEVQSDGSTEITRQYYALAGVSAGMREGGSFSWFLTDHLGSVVGVTDADAILVSQTRYTPFGEIRSDVGTVTETDYGYTFQRNVDGMGLMDYKARYYSPLLGRFTQADSIIPGAGNPQAFNRYSYILNSPINATDPTGHACRRSAEYGTCQFEAEWKTKRVISQEGLEFIKTAEGGNQAMYDDEGPGKGSCTIGYGSFLHGNPCDGNEVKTKVVGGVKGQYVYFRGKWWPAQLWGKDQEGESIWGLSKKTAEAMLTYELSIQADQLHAVLWVPLNQNQWDAVQSFVYNTGRPTDIATAINESNSDFDSVRDMILGAVTSRQGIYYLGLEYRRKKEWDLFRSGNYAW